MPAISMSSHPPVPVDTEQRDVGFNDLPEVALDRICSFLHIADLDALSRVSPVARNAAWWKSLEAACERALLQTHQGELRPLAFDATRFADQAHVHATRFPFMACLLHMEANRARLAAVPTTPATHDVVEIPGLVRFGASGVVLNDAGSPLFVGEVRDGEFGRRIVFCTRQGPPVTPDALRGVCLTGGHRAGGVNIHGAAPAAADTELVIRARDGRMAVYHVNKGTFDWLPEAFRDTSTEVMLGPPLRSAALSSNGQYVAALRDDAVVVYDRHAREMKADVAVPTTDAPATRTAFSVDSSGKVLLAAHGEFTPDAGWHRTGNLPEDPELLVLCPNERYLLGRDRASRHLALVDRKRQGHGCIELRASGPAAFPGTAVAFSLAHDVVAVANGNDTIDLFDLSKALAAPSADVRPVEPARTLTLPETRFLDRSLRFSADGTRLDVVYKIGIRVDFISYTLA